MNEFKRKLQEDYQEYKKEVEKVKKAEIKGLQKYYKMFEKNGEYVGCINTKYEKMQNRYIKVISTFLITSEGKVILELRSKDCRLEPNQIDLCSGHIDNEEKSNETAYRELKEELGVQKESIYMLKKNREEIPLTFYNNKKFLVQFYTAIGKFSAKKIRQNIQKEEVADVKEVTIEECFQLIRKGKTRFPYVGHEEMFEGIFQSVMQEYKNFEKERSIKERQ